MNIMQGLHCYLTQHSPHVLGTKCMFLEVLIEGMLLLLVKLHYFLPTRWQSLTSCQLLFSISLDFFFSSFNNPISLCCNESSLELTSTRAWCSLLLWLLEGVDALTSPLPPHFPRCFSTCGWGLLSSLHACTTHMHHGSCISWLSVFFCFVFLVCLPLFTHYPIK